VTAFAAPGTRAGTQGHLNHEAARRVLFLNVSNDLAL
jgi:hypothetical protein